MLPPSQVSAGRRATCPLCGTKGRLIYAKIKDVLYGARGEWGFRSCSGQGCGLIWQDPVPHCDDLALAYANYYTHDRAIDPGEPRLQVPGGWLGRGYLTRRFNYRFTTGRLPALRVSRVLVLLPRLSAKLDDFVGHLPYESGGTLLEIGCGNGSFMHSMRALGWQVTGVETDPRSVAMNRAAGLDVLEGDLRVLDLPAGHFSAIVLRHVIEHLLEPVETLERCLSLLRPGGRLVMTTPNPEGLGHRVFRSAWRGLEPPRHVHVFNPSSIRLCLERAGFTETSTRSTLHWADGILRQSVLLRFPVLRRSLAGKIVAAGLGGLIAQVELMLRPAGDLYGEELLVTARRGS